MIQKRIASAFLTIAEAAEFLDLSEHSVEVLASQKELPASRVGNQWRFQKSKLEEYLRTRSPRDRMLSQAGAFANDPDLPKLRAQIEKERRRQKSKRR